MSDAIVIGAGHNGLVAALQLARSGRKVTVVERSSEVGGLCAASTELAWLSNSRPKRARPSAATRSRLTPLVSWSRPGTV